MKGAPPIRKTSKLSRAEALHAMASLIEEHMTEQGLSEDEKDKRVAEARQMVESSSGAARAKSR